jgi:Tat protein secretion system quality control protein TatD with DNase activity
MELALKMKRNLSVHCVQAQGPLMDLIHRFAKKHGAAFKDINLDFHSFGGSTEVIKDLQRRYSNLFFSFSTTINSRSPKLKANIQAVKEDRILVESDWNSLDGYLDRLSEIVEMVAAVRDWDIEATCVHATFESFSKNCAVWTSSTAIGRCSLRKKRNSRVA